MIKNRFKSVFFVVMVPVAIVSCKASESGVDNSVGDGFSASYPNLYAQFSAKVNFNALPNYSDVSAVPSYITKDNLGLANIETRVAFAGRILFYDKNLSSDNSVSCSSCHKQANAFSDLAIASTGVNGVTGRHSMRIVNARFADEVRFFWDERAATLEEQTTEPIQDHNEMGFSGQSGAPDLNDLITKLSNIPYYQELFQYAFGSSDITETRIQDALSQFLKSIQSFDSKYDVGRAAAVNDGAPFFNFTADENAGKQLFLAPPGGAGGAGCAGCHRPPEFDIDVNSGNNGVVGNLLGGTDFTVTRSPSLRDLVDANGVTHGPFMHDGSLTTLQDVINHYDSGVVDNVGLDPRLRLPPGGGGPGGGGPGGGVQNLGLTTTEKNQLEAFLRTLTGSDMYTNEKWSDPF